MSHLPPRPQTLSAKIFKNLIVYASEDLFWKSKIFFVKKTFIEKCKFVGPRAPARSAPLNPPLDRTYLWQASNFLLSMLTRAE